MLEELTATFESAIEKRVFPGASCWLSRGDTVFAHQAFGTTAYDAEYSRPAARDTLYDLASLTKLFTTTAFFIAARENKVSADESLAHFLPKFATTDKSAITLRQLMQHNAGLQIAIQSLAEACPDEWLTRIAQSQLCAAPGQRVKYVCANFFLLARVVEKISGEYLDDFIAREILQPLEMTQTTFEPLSEFPIEKIAPTEIYNGNGTPGIVHDEAARAWLNYYRRSNCGNAGLFATTEDVAKFARLWMDEGFAFGRQLIAREDAAQALCGTLASFRKQKRSLREYAGALRRGTLPKPIVVARCGLGWQTHAAFYMSEQAPPDAAGYAGLSGPTVWLSRATRHICIILNNRVYPTRDGPNRFPVHRQVARQLMQAAALI
jgi:CubicO group peptidase (beta-lactamase class C family)